MLTELALDSLGISGVQVSSDNGFTHVSVNISIEDTDHEGLFSLKELLFLRFTDWSLCGV